VTLAVLLRMIQVGLGEVGESWQRTLGRKILIHAAGTILAVWLMAAGSFLWGFLWAVVYQHGGEEIATQALRP